MADELLDHYYRDWNGDLNRIYEVQLLVLIRHMRNVGAVICFLVRTVGGPYPLHLHQQRSRDIERQNPEREQTKPKTIVMKLRAKTLTKGGKRPTKTTAKGRTPRP